MIAEKVETYRAFKKATHCIFGLDGLLLDSEVIYNRVINCLVNTYGKKMNDMLWKKIRGQCEKKTAEILIENLDLPISVDEFVDRYQRMSFQLLKKAPLKKGAERLLRHLQEFNIPCAIVSSSVEKIVDKQMTKRHDLFKHFSHRVCAPCDPEVKKGKPAPDIFVVAARRFKDNPDPDRCLAFQCGALGVIAANHAGMQTVIVPDENVPEEFRKIATHIVVSLDDFRPEEFGLPPYPDK